MLIEFSVANFRSIRDEITLSMVASNTVKELEGEAGESNNVFFDQNDKKYLKSAVIYGANGSGKSNLLTAMLFLKQFVRNSSNSGQGDQVIPVIPFLLNTANKKEPSSFEITFVLDQMRYRYGLQVTQEKVTAEWLFGIEANSKGKESYYFTRDEESIKVNAKNFKEGKNIVGNTRNNALFLSTVAQLNGPLAQGILKWFGSNFNILSGLSDHTVDFTKEKVWKDIEFRKKVVELMRVLNSGMEDIYLQESILENLPVPSPVATQNNSKLTAILDQLKEEVRKLRPDVITDQQDVDVSSMHKQYDAAGNFVDIVALDFDFQSSGTKKLFALLGPWLECLENGEILIVDELDSKFHTKLTAELIKLFHSKLNANNAQLIFASHDTNLLRKDIFRRDQIWFAEKDDKGGTDLYSLVEYKVNQATSVRNDASYEKDYLMGKYGAIPYFGNIERFLNDFVDEQI